MKTSRTLIAVCLVVFITQISSCKRDFLNEKPSTGIVQPKTLDDMVGLLENSIFQNNASELATMSADEFEYRDYNTWRELGRVVDRNSYIWATDLYGDQTYIEEWSKPYTAIFYANTVINALDKITVNQNNIEKYRFAKGWAYFNRAYNFYILASTFCKSYDAQTASSDLGLPLKTSADIDVIMQRSTLQETYQQIFQDLNTAMQFLQNQRTVTEKKTQPSLAAVYAFQARMYLNMREYDKAELAADNCLAMYSNLLDYNTITLPNKKPFTLTNEEVIYASGTLGTFVGMLTSANNQLIKINELLLNLYEPDDLRYKILFVDGSGGDKVMNRNYLSYGFFGFSGLATDEVYLIKAECIARRGDSNGSMTVLNKLLKKRFPPSKFRPKQAESQQQALDILIIERRKELVWRGARWEDLKRLNKEGSNITITRLLNGITYSLLPNDPKYVFPIPSGEIALSGITPNLR